MFLLADIADTVTNALGKVSDVTGAEKVTHLADKATNFLSAHVTQFISGIIILVIGVVVAGWIAQGLTHLLERQKLEPPERLLIVIVARLLMFGLTLMAVAEVCGFSLGATIAGGGVLIVGIGLAMQGLLGNIIAGLTLIFTKPFRVGEYIDILGTQGLVVHVDIISTTLVQMDHSRVVIPNHKIVGEVLRNFGAVRQLNLQIGVGYQTDLTRARELAAGVLSNNKRVLPDPAPMVAVSALKDFAVGLSVKFWVKVADYEAAEGELNEAILETFRRNQIEIPFPQREIRIVNAPGTAENPVRQ